MRQGKKILAAAISLAVAGPVLADPPANTDLPSVFCFRITDVERVVGDQEGDRFKFEFEVLNWTNRSAEGLSIATNVGTSAGVQLVQSSIDADGRGGPNDTAFNNIGNANPAGTESHHSGRGRSDIPGHLNDWNVLDSTSTRAVWSSLDSTGNVTGTSIPNQNLLFGRRPGLVPGLGTDALGDTAIDGGPGPYTSVPGDANPLVAGSPPIPDGSGNVLDGFVIEVDGFGVGDTLSFNWNLLSRNFFDEDLVFAAATADQPFAAALEFDEYGGASCETDPESCLSSIGTQFGGNAFGFGTISLARVAPGGELPGGLFESNGGFNQNPESFFGDVWQVPNPTDFGLEIGAGETAEFQNPNDNLFGNQVNTQLATNEVSEPGTAGMALAGLAGIFAWRRRKNRWA